MREHVHPELPESFDPFAPAEPIELPATPAQLEMWFAAQTSAVASCAFNESFAVHLSGDVNEQALVDALVALPDLHEALRGRFSEDGSIFAIQSRIDVPVGQHDFSGETSDARLRELVAEMSRTPYDLTTGPLFRAAVVRTSPTDVVALFGGHHAVCDGWSLDVLLLDLSRVYNGMVGSAPLPYPPARSFRDFVTDKFSQQFFDQADRARAYWRQVYEVAPAPLSLPHDGTRPAQRTYPAHCALHSVSPEALRAARDASRAHGLSLYSILFSGFATLLHRLSAADDLVIGVPVAGHPDAGMEDAVGHLVNLVPVRCRLDSQQSFLETSQHLSGGLLDARDHSSVGFGEIVADINLPRDPTRVPLVPVIFTHVQKYDADQVRFAGCELDYEGCPRSFESFELNLVAVEARDSLLLRLHGNANLYSKAWLEWRLRELDALLTHACASPGTALEQLELLPSDERNALHAWNDTASSYPRDAALNQLFEAQADRTPERAAVHADDQQLTYAQLEERANRLARLLRRRGAGRGALVGLCLDRSVDMITAVLAVLKCGAAYVPLDPSFPADRLATMAEDAALKLVVSKSELAERHGLPAHRTLDLDSTTDELAAESSERLEDCAGAEETAYILYTSGSTGKPKGVCVHHRAAVNFLTSMAREPGLGSDDRLLAVTTLSFDISLLELMLPLTVGAEVIVATREQAMDGVALGRLLEKHRVTVMQATPVTWRILLESGWTGGDTFRALCGGEALPIDLAERLLPCVGELWNMYGPTETTVWSSCCRVTAPQRGIHIGRPIANTSFLVCDDQMRVCPIGVPGELCIGGDGVSQGYLHRPELTSERFVPDPTAAFADQRVYRTGDLGRIRVDGTIECLGRLDNQVKVRGFRIELGEIETVLTGAPHVDQAVVVAREDDPGDARLVAYLLASEEKAPERDLRDRLKAHLPEYMVPQHFVRLETFPTTPNGKIDRKALPAPQATATVVDAPTAANDVQAKVAEIFAGRLELPGLGTSDNFFENGGSSYLAVATIRDVNEAFGLALPVGALFESPTVAELARLVQKGGGELKSTVVALHKSSGVPTFFICGIALYQTLARNLGDLCSSYGIYVPEEEAFFENYDDPTTITIESLAWSYVDAIRSTVPQGPYVVGGVSAGGLLAFEVARQLTGQGQEVMELLLLDARLPGATMRDWPAQIGLHLDHLREEGIRYGLDKLERLRPHRPSRPQKRAVEEEDRRWLLMRALNGKSTRQYLSSKPSYDGSALIVRASDLSDWEGFRFRHDLGWGPRLRGAVAIDDSPGDHLGILDDPRTADLIVNRVREELNRRRDGDARIARRPKRSLLGRLHLFEFNDQERLPRFMTSWMTRVLHFLHEATQDGRVWAPKLVELMKRYGQAEILDLCSGGGGPVLEVVRILEHEHGIHPRLTLTDLIPNLQTAAEINSGNGKRTYITDPIDATDVPAHLTGVRTMFSGFHHLAPPVAFKLLKHAYETRQHIFIGETTKRSLNAIRIYASAVTHFGEATRHIELTPAQRFFTHAVPILPAMLGWDNVVSCLRTYSKDELALWLDALSTGDYHWEVGELWNPRLGTPYPYIMGYPLPAEQSLTPLPSW